jgi:small subunit ribosomal protein S20
MANIKSQKKRIITNEKRRLRNVSVRSRVRTYIKQAEEAIASKDAARIQAALRDAVRELDKAVSKGVLHANSVARKKSSLHRRVSAARAS